jgi:hypothetical protein
VAAAAGAVAGVAQVQPHITSPSGAWTRIPVLLADPPSSPAARRPIARLRTAVHDVDAATLVGGRTAAALDQDTAMNRDLRLILPMTLILVAIVLGLLLRAVIAPLVLLGCLLLSTTGTVGITAALLHGLSIARTDQTVLLLGGLFLIALGAGYTIFLLSRARKRYSASVTALASRPRWRQPAGSSPAPASSSSPRSWSWPPRLSYSTSNWACSSPSACSSTRSCYAPCWWPHSPPRWESGSGGRHRPPASDEPKTPALRS